MTELVLVCRRCEITPPCPCGDASGLAPTRLADWFDGFWEGSFTIEPVVQYLDDASRDPFRFTDIERIDGHGFGKGDGPSWIALVRLIDGRWVYLSYTSAYTLQITGEVYWTVVVASDRRRLWWYALTDDDRERFTGQLTHELLEEELVQIDELLESRDPEDRARGEARMLQRHRLTATP